MCFDYCRIRVAAAAAASNVARAPSKARLTGQKPSVSELILYVGCYKLFHYKCRLIFCGKYASVGMLIGHTKSLHACEQNIKYKNRWCISVCSLTY